MAQQTTTATDRWGNPLPRKLNLKSGKVVTERFYDKSQYHQNCRKCGGDLFGLPIWYVRSEEARVTPKHATCPAEPVPYVEQPRQPRYDADQARREADIRDGVRHGGTAVGDLGYWLHGQFIEVE